MNAKINLKAYRYLPRDSEAAITQPLGSLGIEALAEALQGGANDDARRAMARAIASVGRKYSAEARETARKIADGELPLPPCPDYMRTA